MSNRNRLSANLARLCLVLTGCLLGVTALRGQASETKTLRPSFPVEQEAVKKALTEAKSGNVSVYGAGLLGMAGTVEVIPYLEKAFANRSDMLERARIAQVLVQLKDRSDVYWDFLAHQAEQVLAADEPNPFAFDAQGKLIPGTSPDFLAWAKAKKLDAAAATDDAMRIHPTEILYLGLTEDRRAIPLLRQALASRNYFIESEAARGLAQFQDATAVPLMIHAAQDAPAEPAELIARWLVYFDNSDAQKAFDTYVPGERAQLYRDAKIKGTGALR